MDKKKKWIKVSGNFPVSHTLTRRPQTGSMSLTSLSSTMKPKLQDIRDLWPELSSCPVSNGVKEFLKFLLLPLLSNIFKHIHTRGVQHFSTVSENWNWENCQVFEDLSLLLSEPRNHVLLHRFITLYTNSFTEVIFSHYLERKKQYLQPIIILVLTKHLNTEKPFKIPLIFFSVQRNK